MGRRKRDQYDYVPDTWWTRDTGGLPGWGIVLAGVVLVALGVVVAVLASR